MSLNLLENPLCINTFVVVALLEEDTGSSLVSGSGWIIEKINILHLRLLSVETCGETWHTKALIFTNAALPV